MIQPEFTVKRIPVAERYGEAAIGSDRLKVGDEIARELGSRTILLVDFENVAPDGYVVFQLLGNLLELRRAKIYEDSLWAFTNTNEDAYFAAEVVASHLKTGVLCQKKAELKFAGTTGVRSATYTFASKLSLGGSFNTTQFAEQLDMAPTAANMRLKNLLPTGALAKLKDGGPRSPGEFRALIESDLQSSLDTLVKGFAHTPTVR